MNITELVITLNTSGGFPSEIIRKVTKAPHKKSRKIKIQINRIVRYLLSNWLNISDSISGRSSGSRTEFENSFIINNLKLACMQIKNMLFIDTK